MKRINKESLTGETPMKRIFDVLEEKLVVSRG